MDKNDVFKLAKSINHEYEVGIWLEINSFLSIRKIKYLTLI